MGRIHSVKFLILFLRLSYDYETKKLDQNMGRIRSVKFLILFLRIVSELRL
jgi:hypothetical protein